MRIAVMGTGGVGGYFGARLAQAGQDVHFIARGRQLAALREHGLRVESPRGHLHLRELQVTDDPASIGSTDLVIFGVKLWDTEAAAAAIRPLVGEDTAVISFQNGVVKDDILKRLLGERVVAGGVGYIAATIAEPGLIRHTGAMQKLVFGEYDGQPSERMKRFAEACAAAGIDHELSPHIRRTLWEKFVFLVGLSGTTATARVPIGPAAALSLVGLGRGGLRRRRLGFGLDPHRVVRPPPAAHLRSAVAGLYLRGQCLVPPPDRPLAADPPAAFLLRPVPGQRAVLVVLRVPQPLRSALRDFRDAAARVCRLSAVRIGMRGGLPPGGGHPAKGRGTP